MILDLTYISKDFYISNKVRFRLIYLLSSLNMTDLHIRSFCHLVNVFISTEFDIKTVVLMKLMSI